MEPKMDIKVIKIHFGISRLERIFIQVIVGIEKIIIMLNREQIIAIPFSFQLLLQKNKITHNLLKILKEQLLEEARVKKIFIFYKFFTKAFNRKES